MKEKEVVLFLPLGSYALDQQLATGLYFDSHSNCKPHFLLISETDHRFIDRLDAAGISYHTLDPVRQHQMMALNVSSNNWRYVAKRGVKILLRRCRRFLTELPVGQFGRNVISLGFSLSWALYQAFPLCRQLWQRKRMAKRIIKPLMPCCAIVSQERVRQFLPILKVLRELKVPIILMPAAVSSPVGCAFLRRNNDMLKAGLNRATGSNGIKKNEFDNRVAILNKLVERWMPSQIYYSRWGRMLFTSSVEIFSLKLMGMLPQNPWYQGTTFVDYIIISGIDEAVMYAEAGVDSGKLLFFGTHELDVLYECWLMRTEMRRKVCRVYHLNSEKQIVIVALPPLWEHGMVSEDVHWQSINEIVRVSCNCNCNVLVSLHPRVDPVNYEWLEDRYPVRIIKETLKEILAIADIFVAVYSSTINWALALGIPVINLDFWGSGLSMGKTLSSYPTITTSTEFYSFLKELASAWKNSTFSTSSGFLDRQIDMFIDGRAKERLLKFIRDLNSRDNSSAGFLPSRKPTQQDELMSSFALHK